MKPDTSRWRDQDQYEFYDVLPVEGVAWECLRRNASYQASFDDLVAQGSGHLPFADDFQHRWGLRFPGRPLLFRARPTGHLVACCQSGRADARGGARFSSAFSVRLIGRSC